MSGQHPIELEDDVPESLYEQHDRAVAAALALGPPTPAKPTIIMRTHVNTYIEDETSLPRDIRAAIDKAIAEWSKYGLNSGWYDTIIDPKKLKAPRIVDTCLYGRFVSSTSTNKWPVVNDENDGEMRFACLRCTNSCRLCCIWDYGRKRIVALPLVPEARESEDVGEVGYWVRRATSQARKKLRELFLDWTPEKKVVVSNASVISEGAEETAVQQEAKGKETEAVME